jgi:hypothetical protein
LPFDILSFNILSFDILSFDILSFDKKTWHPQNAHDGVFPVNPTPVAAVLPASGPADDSLAGAVAAAERPALRGERPRSLYLPARSGKVPEFRIRKCRQI